VVAHAYNPTYSKGGHQEAHGPRLGMKECPQDPVSTNKMLGVVMSTCHPSYMRSVNKRIIVQACLNIKIKTLFKK
jgi:hypothetical protein